MWIGLTKNPEAEASTRPSGEISNEVTQSGNSLCQSSWLVLRSMHWIRPFQSSERLQYRRRLSGEGRAAPKCARSLRLRPAGWRLSIRQEDTSTTQTASPSGFDPV